MVGSYVSDLDPAYFNSCWSLTLLHEQISKGLSVHGWPSGHALDSEETIQFTELEGVKCLIETFPLEKANEAFGKSLTQDAEVLT
jgi:D-arabinose 1-dehydrogenase-like Zn-dependent alcohol dehydrogenase